MDMERGAAYEDLGGKKTELDAGQEEALYNLGLGSREMRARVESRNRAKQGIAQQATNTDGIAVIRNAKIELDRANGIDVNSVEYLAKQRLAERNRSRRF